MLEWNNMNEFCAGHNIIFRLNKYQNKNLTT